MKNLIKDFSRKAISKMKLSGDTLFIVFDTGDYTGIEFTVDYDGERSVEFINDTPWVGYHYEALVELGIMSEDEAKKIFAEADEKAAAAREEKDRTEYIRLKHKYGE